MSRLLVFLHLVLKQRALQAQLQAAAGSIKVTAVGRVADFERALENGHDAVLSLPPVLSAHGLKPVIAGYREGRADEVYSLMAADLAPQPGKVRSVGAVDLLGRNGTTAFTHELLASRPKVERVTKVEDLLPLLQLRRVDAVVLPARLVPELQAASEMKLVTYDLRKRVGLPALAFLSPKGRQAGSAVARLDREISLQLGVDEWR
jgi:hypothetical protein